MIRIQFDETLAKRQSEQAMETIARLYAALTMVKTLVSGEAAPRWDNSPETTTTRGRIADICDIALGKNH